ncbi:helix-turn-helix transcriptional regulator, partial [Shigella flexneri]
IGITPPEEDNFTASRKLAAGCKNIMVRRTNQLNGVPHR